MGKKKVTSVKNKEKEVSKENEKLNKRDNDEIKSSNINHNHNIVTKPISENSMNNDRKLKLVMPMRHRRDKINDVMSRGQKRRLLKKSKFLSRELLEKKISEKLGYNKDKRKEVEKRKEENKKFYFNKIDDELNDLIEGMNNNIKGNSINNNNTNYKVNSQNNANISVNSNQKSLILETQKSVFSKSNKNKRYKLNNLIEEERNKIESVLNNNNFLQNPIESVKNHIFNVQLLQERQNKINQNFVNNMNKLYNN